MWEACNTKGYDWAVKEMLLYWQNIQVKFRNTLLVQCQNFTTSQ